MDETLIDYELMKSESWARLSAAASDPGHPLRLCTVSTVAADEPDGRLLVIRGASESHQCVWFHTDARSRKVDQLRGNPNVCVVTYDRHDGVQLRLRGTATIRTDDHVADQHWEQLEVTARYAYGVSPAPGSDAARLDPRAAAHHRQLDVNTELEGRENFAVIETVITDLEWLQIGSLGDRRAILRAANDWRVQPLAP